MTLACRSPPSWSACCGPRRLSLPSVEADVIDLQYSESIRLVRLLRRLNPSARITGTFHDVMSQSFSREPQDTPATRRYWQRVARRSRKHEKAMVARLDEVLVFSSKDAELLGNPPHTVVHPPLSAGQEPRHVPATQPVVVVVSYLARDENNKAALWTLEHVWPRVRELRPDAVLRFVGGGVTERAPGTCGGTPTRQGRGAHGFRRRPRQRSTTPLPLRWCRCCRAPA